MAYNSAYTGSQVDAAVGAVRQKETIWDGKQDELTGTEDQLVGFNSAGKAVAVPKPDPLPAGGETGQVLTKTAEGTAWDDIPSDLPAGGTDGQILTKTAEGVAWEDAPEAGVTSFKGRTGAVTPQDGDYTAEMVGAAKPGDVFTVTLLASGWSEKSQSAANDLFLAEGYAYFTNPADGDYTAWNEGMVRGQDVTTDGQMPFTCSETPSGNITVKIFRVEVTEE